jgi:hypothetical protein
MRAGNKSQCREFCAAGFQRRSKNLGQRLVNIAHNSGSFARQMRFLRFGAQNSQAIAGKSRKKQPCDAVFCTVKCKTQMQYFAGR